jgi:acyl-CoA synthetase (AMP-forming)/AMP-acid ligase II
MYGLTEAFRSTYLDPSEVDAHPDSIGRPIPNTEVLVLGTNGRECAPGEVGELVHRGPTVATGYWGHPEATARTFRRLRLGDAGSETVVHSGDLVRRDEAGLLYFVGRRDGIFKSRGVRVNPDEIELELHRCPDVADAIVFPAPGHPPGSEPPIVAAFVPSRDRDPSATVERFCRSDLPPHMRPARLVPVDHIPRTPHGKPDRVRASELWGGPP